MKQQGRKHNRVTKTTLAILLSATLSPLCYADNPNLTDTVFKTGDIEIGSGTSGGRDMGDGSTTYPGYKSVIRSLTATNGTLYVGPIKVNLRELTEEDKFTYNYQTTDDAGTGVRDFDIASELWDRTTRPDSIAFGDDYDTILSKLTEYTDPEKNYIATLLNEHNQIDLTKSAGTMKLINMTAEMSGVDITGKTINTEDSTITITKYTGAGKGDADADTTSFTADKFSLHETDITVEDDAVLDTTNVTDSEFISSGVVVKEGGTLKLGKSAFKTNTDSDKGGAGIRNEGGSIEIADGTSFTELSTLDPASQPNPADAGRGGAIAVRGASSENLTMNNIVFESNTADSRGGAIYNGSGSVADLNITASEFNNNIAKQWVGGAIANQGGNLNVENSTFDKNAVIVYKSGMPNAGISGGAIYHSAKDMFVAESTFTNNVAVYDITEGQGNKALGGAIYAQHKTPASSTQQIFDSVFKNNFASTYGGAVYLQSGNLLIENNTFEDNSTIWVGGAIASESGAGFPNSLTINNSKFINNASAADSGAVGGYKDVNITDSLFEGNSTGLADPIKTTIDALPSTITDNLKNALKADADTASTESAGGGAVFLGGTSASVTDSTISGATLFKNNISGSDGGAIATRPTTTASAQITADFTGNKALGTTGSAVLTGTTGRGGAIFNAFDNSVNADNDMNITNSNFTENEAVNGGAVYNYKGVSMSGTGDYNAHIDIDGSTFNNNIATENGGAIYNAANATISDTSFSNNSAGANGGAIYNSGTLTLSAITDSIDFVNNTAAKGGALYNTGTVNLEADNDLDIYFSDSVSGDNGKININGNVTFNNTVDNNAITINSQGGLHLGSNGHITSGSLNLNKGKLSTGDYAKKETVINHIISTVENPSVFGFDWGDKLKLNSAASEDGSISAIVILYDSDLADSAQYTYFTGVSDFNFKKDSDGNISYTYTPQKTYAIKQNVKDLVMSSSAIANPGTALITTIDKTNDIGSAHFIATTNETVTSNTTDDLGTIGTNEILTIVSQNKSGITAGVGMSGNPMEGMTVAKGATVEIVGIGDWTIDPNYNITVNQAFEGFSSLGDGGLLNSAGSVFIAESSLQHNSAANYGGVVKNMYDKTLNVVESVVISNDAGLGGGAFANVANSNVPVTDQPLGNNTDAAGNIINSAINNNIATGTLTTTATGGAVYNFAGMTNTSLPLDAILNITGSLFKENKAGIDTTGTATALNGQGGVLYNTSVGGATGGDAIINVTNSKFIENAALTDGGAIYNTNTNSVITIQDSEFTNNTTGTNGTTGTGGAIFNDSNSELQMTDTTFDGNASGDGGALYNKGKVTNATDITFKNNESVNDGGAVHNAAGATIGSGAAGSIEFVNSTFANNNANFGGAIFNNNNADIILTDSDLIGNTAKQDGGAIYTTGTNIEINAVTKDVTIDGNLSNYDPATGIGDSVAIHFNNTPGTPVDLKLNADTGKEIVLIDGVSLNSTDSLTITAGAAGGGGTVTIGDAINFGLGVAPLNYNLNAGTLDFTDDSALNNANNLTVANGTVLNIANDTPSAINLTGNLDLPVGTVSLITDITDNGIDTITAATTSTAGGTFTPGTTTVAINAVIPDTLNNRELNINLDDLITDAAGVIASGDINYDTSALTNGGVMQDVIYRRAFKRSGSCLKLAPISTGYAGYNPAVFASSVALQSSFLTQVNTYNQAFGNIDQNMLLTSTQRKALRDANTYASADETNPMVYSPTFLPDRDPGVWFRPYATFENVKLVNGPEVNNVMYGSLVGGDTPMFRIGESDWDGQVSVYAGYNGSHQTYDGISIYQNGGSLGATGAVYKGNFFSALTANVGVSVADMSTMFGKNDMTILSTGVASKTGYNWELFKGKLIVQPSWLMSYSFITPFGDYTNGAGVRMKQDPVNAIQLVPGIKFIFNLPRGWQPYLGANMVWNLIDETKVKANLTNLPETSVDPYFEYGIGVQKHVGERFTGFGQAMFRAGGRTGASFSLGLRWAVGHLEKKQPGVRPSKSTKKSQTLRNLSLAQK